MGLRFRQSFSAGPIKATISKSGIGGSIGIPGARITKKANGNTMSTLSIPGTGISYVKEKSNNFKKSNTQIKKEKEQKIFNKDKEKPNDFYDLIPFDNLKDKYLFLLAWQSTIENKYGKDYEGVQELSELLDTTFTISDINKKHDGTIIKAYTSNHFNSMIEKDFFIKESRGKYKINLYKIAPYAKEFYSNI